jgi:diguanylate cyclase (GGDEF)-like protein
MDEEKKIDILIVDDDADARETIGELLTLSGEFAVKTADTGTKALEILKHGSVDLVISDLLMPEMDGIALTKNIKEQGIDIPIIVTTGFASVERAVQSMQAGAADFITKPFNFNQIKITVEKALVTKKLQDEREFYKKLSNSDALTELANYRYFQKVLQKEMARAERYNRPLSLMMIDIDDFKSCNDTHGHPAGDVVLKEIAMLIKKNTRGCDLTARYGGEEFSVILPETSEEETLVVAERIRESVEKHSFKTEENKPINNLSITIGLSSFPDKTKDKKKLIDTADSALYKGKRSGKNCVVIYREAEK